MEQVRVTFQPSGASVTVKAGSTASDAAREAGVRLDLPCGGIGRCGRCAVGIDGTVSPPTGDELRGIDPADLARGIRLACRVRLLSDATVHVPERGSVKIVTDATTAASQEVEPPFARGIVASGTSQHLLGAAVDIGTTTVTVTLVDLGNGDRVAGAGMLNAQYPWGADVMTRVTMALREGVDVLRRPIAMQLERMIAGLLPSLGAEPADVRELAITGNAVMTGALLGAPLAPFASAPYLGAEVRAVCRTAARIGMPLLGDAACYVLPGVSAFVGADAVAGMLATDLAHSPEGTMLLDLGTNAEICLVTPSGIAATSAPAGPALEGAGIMSGMRAEPGAIERVWVAGGDIVSATVDGAPALGICGSGALDLLAALLDAGVMDASGRLLDGVAGPLGARVFERGDVRALAVDAGGDVVLTQTDVRALQLAKGAVRAAIDMVLAETGVAPEDVPRVLVAGGFGYHVSGPALERIGMIPDGWAERLTFVGNVAGEGARLALVSSAARRDAEALAARVRTVDLASHPRFQDRYLASLDFPPTP